MVLWVDSDMQKLEQDDALQLREVYGEFLAPDETEFLEWLVRRFADVLEQARGFNAAIEELKQRLLDIAPRLNPMARCNVDLLLLVRTVGDAASPLAGRDAALTAEEEGFARDVIGVVGFVTRNRIGFPLIVNVLSHDVAEVVHQGSLARALEFGFLPKTAGWAQYTPDSFGAPEEAGDN